MPRSSRVEAILQKPGISAAPRAIEVWVCLSAEPRDPSDREPAVRHGCFHPDNNIVRYIWERVTPQQRFILGFAPIITVQSPPGGSTYELRVVDAKSEASTARVEVSVVDTTPPVLSSAPTAPACVWPPNYKWAEFILGRDISVTAIDACDPSPPSIRIDGVRVGENGSIRPATSDEAVFGANAVCARSEREGSSEEGREYIFDLVATDRAGNALHVPVTTLVGHDSSPDSRCNQEVSLYDDPTEACAPGEVQP